MVIFHKNSSETLPHFSTKSYYLNNAQALHSIPSPNLLRLVIIPPSLPWLTSSFPSYLLVGGIPSVWYSARVLTIRYYVVAKHAGSLSSSSFQLPTYLLSSFIQLLVVSFLEERGKIKVAKKNSSASCIQATSNHNISKQKINLQLPSTKHIIIWTSK